MKKRKEEIIKKLRKRNKKEKDFEKGKLYFLELFYCTHLNYSKRRFFFFINNVSKSLFYYILQFHFLLLCLFSVIFFFTFIQL